MKRQTLLPILALPVERSGRDSQDNYNNIETNSVNPSTTCYHDRHCPPFKECVGGICLTKYSGGGM